MIGDRVIPKPHHTRAAEQIVRLLKEPVSGRPVASVAGESGAGKSEIAVELLRLYQTKGYSLFVFAQDDYFFYPPRTNEAMRKRDITHVGIGEVNLALLDDNLAGFARSRTKPIKKPLVVFEEDRITEEFIDPGQFNMGVAEGTYTSLLQNVDYRIFIDRTYQDTLDDRIARRRDPIDEFSDKILTIEHKIISEHRALADIIVKSDFSVTLTERGKDRV
jgi:uridine kinase